MKFNKKQERVMSFVRLDVFRSGHERIPIETKIAIADLREDAERLTFNQLGEVWLGMINRWGWPVRLKPGEFELALNDYDKTTKPLVLDLYVYGTAEESRNSKEQLIALLNNQLSLGIPLNSALNLYLCNDAKFQQTDRTGIVTPQASNRSPDYKLLFGSAANHHTRMEGKWKSSLKSLNDWSEIAG